MGMANQTVDIPVEMFYSTWRSLGRTAPDEPILDTGGLRSPIFTTDCFSRKIAAQKLCNSLNPG